MFGLLKRLFSSEERKIAAKRKKRLNRAPEEWMQYGRDVAKHQEDMKKLYPPKYSPDPSKGMYVVYHIRRSKNDSTSVGYIGVAKNFKRRRFEHLDRLAAGKHCNKHLTRENEKGKGLANRHFAIVKEDLSEMAAYELERNLRPSPNMGWNIRKGGQ